MSDGQSGPAEKVAGGAQDNPGPPGGPSTTWHGEVQALRRRMDRNAHGHISQALRLKLSNDIATFINTIGGAALMALSAFLIFYPNAPTPAVPIAIEAMSALITLVGVWQAVWQPGARADHHKAWAIEFLAIENECQLMACGESSATLASQVARSVEVTRGADLVPENQWRRGRRRAEETP